jgi:integrase/recombinase XerD
MTPLRICMKEELQRRNHSEMTAVCYVRHVAEFARFFRRSPDSLGAEEIKQFQLHLIREKKISWSTSGAVERDHCR